MKDHQEGHRSPKRTRAAPSRHVRFIPWPSGGRGAWPPQWEPREDPAAARGAAARDPGAAVPGGYAPGYPGAPSYGYGGRYGGLGPYSNYGGYGGYAGSGAVRPAGVDRPRRRRRSGNRTGGLGPRSKARRSSRVIHMHGVSASRGPRWLRRGAFWLAAFGLVVLLIVWLRGLPLLSTLFHAIFAPLRP